jgi:hypothetical protein
VVSSIFFSQRRKERKGEMYLLLHEIISFHDPSFAGLAAFREYISAAFPSSQIMLSQQNSMARAGMKQPVRL